MPSILMHSFSRGVQIECWEKKKQKFPLLFLAGCLHFPSAATPQRKVAKERQLDKKYRDAQKWQRNVQRGGKKQLIAIHSYLTALVAPVKDESPAIVFPAPNTHTHTHTNKTLYFPYFWPFYLRGHFTSATLQRKSSAIN